MRGAAGDRRSERIWLGALIAAGVLVARRNAAARDRRTLAELLAERHDRLERHVAQVRVQAGVAQAILETDPDAARHALTRAQAATGELLAELREARRLLADV